MKLVGSYISAHILVHFLQATEDRGEGAPVPGPLPRERGRFCWVLSNASVLSRMKCPSSLHVLNFMTCIVHR